MITRVTSWAELTGYMRRMLLRDSDQMSMAVSLELRVPFLDHELVEYVLGLAGGGEETLWRAPKGLLVEACRDLLPRSVYDRPKPASPCRCKRWMRGPLAAFVDEGAEQAVVERELLPHAFVHDYSAGLSTKVACIGRACGASWCSATLRSDAILSGVPNEATPLHSLSLTLRSVDRSSGSSNPQLS